MMYQENENPAAGATASGAGSNAVAESAATPKLAQARSARNHPRLRLTHRYGRLWAEVDGVDCLYPVDIADLDQPAFLAGRILQMARDLRGDDGGPYAIQARPVLEKLLIGPLHTFDDWDATVDAALAAIGGAG